MAAWKTPPLPMGEPAAEVDDEDWPPPLLGTLLRIGVMVRVAGTGLVMVADCGRCSGCCTFGG
jgi:hypothetical protein